MFPVDTQHIHSNERNPLLRVCYAQRDSTGSLRLLPSDVGDRCRLPVRTFSGSVDALRASGRSRSSQHDTGV